MSNSPDILTRIVSSKQKELAETKLAVTVSQLHALIARQTPPRNFGAALRGDKVRLIAEIKKASPSKGLLCPQFEPMSLAKTYAENGAAAISVLTESQFFLGSTSHLWAIRQAQVQNNLPGIPLLRKDFIFEEYQVLESRAIGADAILLIVAILDDAHLKALIEASYRLKMRCLVEVHDAEEVRRALAVGAGIIGINNRDLRTFRVDIAATERLRPLIPDDRIVVSESGIEFRSDMRRLQRAGVQAALVGEALVTAADIPAKVRELACLE